MSAIYRSNDARRAIEDAYRRALDAWPVAHDEIYVDTCQGPTFVVASGPIDAAALVLFQGSGANAALWMNDVVELASSFRIYCIDVIGEPGLSAPNRPPLDSDAYARWIDDVLRGLGVSSASFVGVSLGGWLVLDYAIRRPHAVQSAVVLCPSGVGRQRGSFMLKALPLMLFGNRGRRRIIRMLAGRMMPAVPPACVAEMLAVIRRHFRPRREKMPVFSDDKLERLDVPLLAIVGGRDAMIDSFETQRRLERLVPRARVKLLVEAGHLLPTQTPAVVEFLSAARSTTLETTVAVDR